MATHWEARPVGHVDCDAEIARLRAESDGRQALLNAAYGEKCALQGALRHAVVVARRIQQEHAETAAAAGRELAWLRRRVDALERTVRAKHTELTNLRGEQ